jgi:YD repeat-containing protein
LTITDTDTGESDSLARAAFIQAISSTVIHYDYDGLYRLIEAQYTGAISATYGYDYDKVGNMIAYTETITSTTVVTRTFDNANRLETSNDASGNTVYTYDDNGNLTVIDPPGASGTIQYGYDQRNLMITSTVDGSAVASFAYDGMNNRLQQVDFTGPTVITTTYANDILGLSQVLIADDGTNQVVNLFGLDLILQDDGTGALALLADGLGSVRLEMVGGAVESTTTYSPYGTELAQEGTSDTVYGFTGEQEDGSTGLLYLRARYYSFSQDVHESRPVGGHGLAAGDAQLLCVCGR